MPMQIIAHRGASAEKPENTPSAFERALEIGVDGIETDLLLTADKRLIVRHDDLIEASNGSTRVSHLTFDELRKINPELLSAEELLEGFAKRCPLVLDLKSLGTAPVLLPLIRQYQAIDQVHLTSFLHSEILELGQAIPEVDRSITLSSVPIDFKPLLEAAGVTQISLFRGYLNQPVVEQLKASGVRVRTYPVNLLEEARQFADWGIDAIYTDDPALMQTFRTGGSS